MTLLIESLKSLLLGGIVGGLFALLRLPVPAPNAIPPLMGIVGITLGFMLIAYLLKNFG